MPITPFLDDRVFDPETVETLGAVFSRVCSELGLADRSDKISEVVARHIIEAALRGVRMQDALYSETIRVFASNAS